MGGEKESLGMSELGCADGCGRRGCKGVGGNGRVEGTAGDERAWMPGRRRTAWVQESGWEWVGREAAGDERSWMRGRLRTGVGRKEKEPLGMSELGCADGCGRRRCKGVGGNGGRGSKGKGAAGDERAWMRGRLRTASGVGVNGQGEEAAGDERAWMRGRLRRRGCKGMGKEMGREKEPLGMSELGCADGCERCAIERVEMGRENLLLAMSEVECADGCGWHGCKGVGGKRRKQTTARNEAGEICCVGCGGVDRRGRPRGSGAEAVEVESSALGSDDDAPCAKTRGIIDFAGTKFTEHAEFLPGAFREKVKRWAEALGVTNRRLFESFMYFVVQYCAAQPVGFFTDSVRGELVEAVAGTPAVHRAVVEQGCKGGILPLLDGFGRKRAQFACKLHRRVFGEDAAVTVESLAAWMLLECIFRYTGDSKVLETFFFNADHLVEVREAAARGVSSLALRLGDILRKEVQGRTTVKALFSTRDGRRRTYRKKRGLGEDVVVAAVAPDSKFFDHMVLALEAWGSQATGVAQSLLALIQCIESQTDNLEEDERLVFEQCLSRSSQEQGQAEQNLSQGLRERLEAMQRVTEDFMFCLLGLDLLGRPAGTELVQRNTVAVWRQLRAILARELGGYWDLYAVQMLPCTWRSFLVTALKYRDSDSADLEVEWLTAARRQALRVFELETSRLEELRAWLRHCNMEAEFGALPSSAQREVLTEVRFLPTLKAAVLRKLFTKALSREQVPAIGNV
eukprot:s4134_g11.t1